jgi:hypothetical protein
MPCEFIQGSTDALSVLDPTLVFEVDCLRDEIVDHCGMSEGVFEAGSVQASRSNRGGNSSHHLLLAKHKISQEWFSHLERRRHSAF